MFGTKKFLTVAALAVITTAGLAGTASAQPYRHNGGYQQDIRRDDRRDDQARIRHILRQNDLRMVSAPRLVRGDRYTVRVKDRFGRVRMVQVNAHNGRVIRL